MAGEGDKTRWVGVRPINPAENIPVDLKALVNVPIIPASPEQILTRYEPPYGCTNVFESDYTAGVISTIYTVPDDTVFYLTSFGISLNPVTAGYGSIDIYTDASVLYSTLILLLRVISAGTSQWVNLNIAIPLPEKYYISIYSNGVGVGVYGSIIGYTRPV